MKKTIMRRLLAMLLAIVSSVGAFATSLTVEVSAASEDAYVAECDYDRRIRNDDGEKTDIVIPAGADFVVRGVNKKDPSRLDVWYQEEYGNIDKKHVHKVEGAYVATNTADRRMRDSKNNKLEYIVKGSYFPCYGPSTNKYEGDRLEVAWGTCEGSILASCVKEVTTVKSGTSTITSSGGSNKDTSKGPSTSGKNAYLAVNEYLYRIRDQKGNWIGEYLSEFSVSMCYGPVQGDSSRVGVDKDFDGNIDGKVLAGSVSKVDKEAIIVSRTDQMVYVIRNGKVVASSVCRTGTKGVADTNLGIHEMLEMKWSTYLKGYNSKGEFYKKWVQVWIKINWDEEGLHDAWWLSFDSFGGNTYLTNGSLGCVNLPTAFAKSLYRNYAFVGEMVIVTDASLKGLK